MVVVSYVKIEGFKGFREPIRVDLATTSVLIGPNNAGKTTVIQALSLWSRAVREWFAKRGAAGGKVRYGVGINRLNIMDIPVRESRFYWHDTKVRSGARPISFSIEVGVMWRGHEWPVRMLFSCRDQESVFCRPDGDSLENAELLRHVQELRFHLLYPMSGIAAGAMDGTAEFLINDGQMNVQLGQGQTSHVLRNLCYRVWQQSPEQWKELCHLMDILFMVRLDVPRLDEGRSILTLNYRSSQGEKASASLEIALGGRGMQQVLLLLAYLYTHVGAVLMIDEPDAHLEILRQRQVYAILREVARKTASQLIIATHSEVILDEASDASLAFLLEGRNIELPKREDIRSTLRTLGVEHFYKATICPRLLVVEGSTDLDMLRTFAHRLNHPAQRHLDGRLFYYYAKDVRAEQGLEDSLLRQATPADQYKRYFFTLQRLVPELKALVLLDGDGRDHSGQDGAEDRGMTTLYWRRYELENYFITPELLVRYIQAHEGGDLWGQTRVQAMREVVDDVLAEMLYEGRADGVQEFHQLGQQTRLQLLAGRKMSLFAEKAFRLFAERERQPIPLNKGEFFQLIDLLQPEEIAPEVTDKLNAVQQLFEA